MLLLLLTSIFTLAAGKVQEHEIVYPRMIISRSGEKRLMFRAFERDFHLRLEPTNILSDDFVLITRIDDEVVYMKPNIEHLRNSILQDPAIGATVAVDDSGPLQIRGIINEELRIAPDSTFNPSHYKVKHGHGGHGGYKERIYHKLNQGKLTGEIPHRVTKVIPRTDGGYFDEVVPPGKKGGNDSISDAEVRQNTKMTIETAVVCDKLHSSKFPNEMVHLTYVCILMNCAAMTFKTMRNANLEFRLSKFKRNLMSADEPYITENMYNGQVLSEPLLSDFSTYISNNKDLSSADIVNLVCAQEMGDEDDSSSIEGIAYVGGVCDRTYKYSASQDSGVYFDGSLNVAHEMAHLLGAPHDGDPPVSYIPGSPGAEECSSDLGYIMSYVRKVEKQYVFSSCSEKCVLQLLQQSSSDCVRRKDVNGSLSIRDCRLLGRFLADNTRAYDMKSVYDKRCFNKRSDLSVDKLPQNDCLYTCRS